MTLWALCDHLENPGNIDDNELMDLCGKVLAGCGINLDMAKEYLVKTISQHLSDTAKSRLDSLLSNNKNANYYGFYFREYDTYPHNR